MIKHNSIFDTDKICELYSKKDGVPVKYVCTTSLDDGTNAIDVFYRSTPHPQFGNKYFGFYVANNGDYMITNADTVEKLEFACVKDDNGDLQYSSHRWDCKQYNHSSIDGGRAYVKFSGETPVVYNILNGEFVEKYK